MNRHRLDPESSSSSSSESSSESSSDDDFKPKEYIKSLIETKDDTSSSSDSDSDSSSDSDTSSSSDSDSSSEHCEISNSKTMPTLNVSCLKQHLVHGKKCFKNECLDVTKLISISNIGGNIVQVRNSDGDTYVVKWNKYKNNISEFKNEVRIQKKASELKIAPQVLQIYEQKSEKYSGGYIYMFMTDLVKLRYKTISEYFGTFNNKGQQTGFKKLKNEDNDLPDKMVRKIAEAVKKLHSLGIAHRNLHPGNIFTNGENIVFNNFGLSEMYDSKEEAWLNEKYSTNQKFITSYGVKNEHFIPNNWKNIKILSKVD